MTCSFRLILSDSLRPMGGCPDGISGKFGINALAGAAYNFDGVPVVLALDFRPGYGLGFTEANVPHSSFFDWKLAFAVRYRL